MSLPAPALATLATQWQFQPLACAVALALLWWWGRALSRLRALEHSWPVRRSVGFLLAVAVFVWVTNGFPQVYARSVLAVWVSQSLMLFLIVPALMLAAQPVELARAAYGHTSLLFKMISSRVGQFLGSPFIGPAAVPIVCSLLYFGVVPGWVAQYQLVHWVFSLTLVALGATLVLPLMATDVDRTGSLAVGLALAVGLVELVVDAMPGIILRLQTKPASTFFDHRLVHLWSSAPLADQQGAGAILWCAAELLDLPFIVLIFRRWVQADARDAAEIDTVLEAERISRNALELPMDESVGAADQPWWLHDPSMRERFKRG